MSLRVKLLATFTLALIASIGLMDWGVERYARAQFQEVDRQRSGALVAQFHEELQQRGEEVVSGVQDIADAESTTRMVLDLSHPQSDASVYANDARGLAEAHQLDYLELASGDGTLISVAQWPAQVGYKNDWVTHEANWNAQGAFLDRIELSDGVDLGLLAVRVVHVGDQNFYIIGGRRLDRNFLQDLELPAGMRALLYRNLEDAFIPAALTSAEGPVAESERFASLIESLQKTALSSQQSSSIQPSPAQTSSAQASGDNASSGQLSVGQLIDQSIQWTADPVSAEKFAAVPLAGRHGELLGALLLGSSQSGLVSLLNYVRGLALVVVAGAILIGFVMSWWISARVSRPLARLAGGMDEVAGGDWDARLEARSGGEIGALLRSFNRMTDRVTEERARILTAERVAAWREMAQQLAREVHAGITPLQKAVEALARAREEASGEFDQVYSESLATLRVELRILQAAAEGLVDFSRGPEGQSEALRINDVVRAAVKSFEPQFCAMGRPPITPELYLDDELASVRGNADRLRKAVEGLVYRALVDMPAGGTLTVRTKQQGNMAHLVISDTGRGFEIENPSRIFSMQTAAGTGLGTGAGPMVGEGLVLATVQAIISDHGGRISVESAPGAGTTFFLDLPAAAVENASGRNVKPKAAKPKIMPREAQVSAAAAHHPIIEASSHLAAEPIAEGTTETLLGQTFDVASAPASEAVFELTSEVPFELAPREDLEYKAETSRESEVEAVGQACLDFVPENAADSAFEDPMDVADPLGMTEVEIAWQMLEAMNIEGPSDGSDEDVADHRAQFLAEAPEVLALDKKNDMMLLEEIDAPPATVPEDVQLHEQFEERSELKTQSAETPSLNALEDMLEAKGVSAPEESSEKVAEDASAKVEEKWLWRSPLTYR